MVTYNRVGAGVIGFIASLIPIALLVAIILAQWYTHRFYNEQPEQTDATRYLDKFHFALFIIMCVGIGLSVLSAIGLYGFAKVKNIR